MGNGASCPAADLASFFTILEVSGQEVSGSFSACLTSNSVIRVTFSNSGLMSSEMPLKSSASSSRFRSSGSSIKPAFTRDARARSRYSLYSSLNAIMVFLLLGFPGSAGHVGGRTPSRASCSMIFFA